MWRFTGRLSRGMGILGAVALAAVGVAPPTFTQVPGPAAYAPPPYQAEAPSLEPLVAPIALYPDELLAVVLRAVTEPLQVVQAGRFLDKLAKDKSLQPNPAWSEPVRILINYPDVLKKLNDDLDWTEQLSQAVRTQQGDVLAAVQQFRRRVAAAGNLVSDDKLTVAQDSGGVYVIESANPQVIYVPVYDPAVVVVPHPTPPQPVYVPTPYPAYYDPYPAAAAAATGFFFGALTTAWAMDWYRYDIDEDDIRDFQEYRQQSITQRQQTRQQAAQQRQQQRQANTDQRQQQRQDNRTQRQENRQDGLRPGQHGGGQQDLGSILSGRQPGQSPGQGGIGQGGIGQGGLGQGGGARPSQLPSQGNRFQGGGNFQGGGGFDRGSYQRPGQLPRGGGARPAQLPSGGGAFNYGSGRNAVQNSNRGMQSRSYNGGARSGGARAGGARAGGGGRGGRR